MRKLFSEFGLLALSAIAASTAVTIFLTLLYQDTTIREFIRMWLGKLS